MSLQQQILLRHRSDGHLRFALPTALCAPDLGDRLVAGLQSMEGVYRVDLYAKQGKLSIRFLDTVCDFAAVVRRLYALVGELAKKAVAPRTAASACCSESRSIQLQAAASGLAGWVKAKLQEAKETMTALGILAGTGFKAISQKPRWMTEFLNDLLMLYLIKLHWHHILYLWLPNPWQHRYEWMATFYLIYLSVQARLPKPA
jgi:hypothetical protein